MVDACKLVKHSMPRRKNQSWALVISLVAKTWWFFWGFLFEEHSLNLVIRALLNDGPEIVFKVCKRECPVLKSLAKKQNQTFKQVAQFFPAFLGCFSILSVGLRKMQTENTAYYSSVTFSTFEIHQLLTLTFWGVDGTGPPGTSSKNWFYLWFIGLRGTFVWIFIVLTDVYKHSCLLVIESDQFKPSVCSLVLENLHRG